jgi:hypothetical protein
MKKWRLVREVKMMRGGGFQVTREDGKVRVSVRRGYKRYYLDLKPDSARRFADSIRTMAGADEQ